RAHGRGRDAARFGAVRPLCRQGGRIGFQEFRHGLDSAGGFTHSDRPRRGWGRGRGDGRTRIRARGKDQRLRTGQGTDMALTKAEMAERLYEEVGLNKREAKEFVDAFFEALREGL